MIQDENSQNNFVIPYEEKPPVEFEPHQEEIRVYEENKHIKWKECFMAYWRFFAVTAAFAALFLFIYIIMDPTVTDNFSESSESDAQTEADTPVAALPESSESQEEIKSDPIYYSPIVLDESMIGFDIEDETECDYSLSPLMGASDGIKVIIIHSHNSEYVSETLSVTAIGQVLAQILNSGGIETLHCQTVHDKDGTVGAYVRMNETLESLREENGGAVLVIDIHDSDSGKPLTFTVGTGFEYGWRENLNLVSAISRYTSDTESAIRLLPAALGQDSGILTLNIGICGNDYSDAEARKVLASLAKALLLICEKSTPAETDR